MGIFTKKDENENIFQGYLFYYSGFPHYPNDGKYKLVKVLIDEENDSITFREDTAFGAKPHYKDVVLSCSQVYSAKNELIDVQQTASGLGGAIVGGVLSGGSGAVTGTILTRGRKKIKPVTFFVIRYISSSGSPKRLLFRNGAVEPLATVKELKKIASGNQNIAPKESNHINL